MKGTIKKRVIAMLLVTHICVGFGGVALGIYILPILIAPEAPLASDITAMSSSATYSAEFKKDLADSDALHWGEGTVNVGAENITLLGSLAPGPDYKLYLSPEYLETEAKFEQLKAKMVRIGDVKTFDNFVVSVPSTININDYTTVIVWCETFGEFITSAQYRDETTSN